MDPRSVGRIYSKPSTFLLNYVKELCVLGQNGSSCMVKRSKALLLIFKSNHSCLPEKFHAMVYFHSVSDGIVLHLAKPNDAAVNNDCLHVKKREKSFATVKMSSYFCLKTKCTIYLPIGAF